MKLKILVITYNIERAREHEWYVEMLDNNLFHLEFALINKSNSFLAGFLRSKGVKVHALNYTGKKDLLSLTWKLYRIIRRNKYDIVHAHLFEAALTGMVAAQLAGVKKRVVTRHNSDFHHVYFPSAVKYDKLINTLATKIIAVSRNVQNILISKENVPPSKVVLIHHGIDLNEFESANISGEQVSAIRNAYNIPVDKPVIGVISRFIEWKGLQYIIPAFKDILNDFPSAVLVLANAQGPYKKEVMQLLDGIKCENYRLIEFESDVAALLKTFTCFVHTPVSETAEAFGQTYIESLACGIPSVFTKSGIASEFAENRVNCLLVPYKDSSAISRAVISILRNESYSQDMINSGRKYVREHFDKKIKYDKISKLYSEL